MAFFYGSPSSSSTFVIKHFHIKIQQLTIQYIFQFNTAIDKGFWNNSVTYFYRYNMEEK